METTQATLSFKQLRNGNWGIRSDAKLDLNEVIEVPTKGGALRSATPKTLIWSGENDEGVMTYIYAIEEAAPGKEKASQAQVQDAVKAMKLAASLQERLNKASKAFGELQEYIHALEARVVALEASQATGKDIAEAPWSNEEPQAAPEAMVA